MTAETLAIALVVLVGATIIGMVKQFFTEPRHHQEGTVYIETRAYQPVPAPEPRLLPATPYRPVLREVPEPAMAYRRVRREVPQPALALASESSG